MILLDMIVENTTNEKRTEKSSPSMRTGLTRIEKLKEKQRFPRWWQ